MADGRDIRLTDGTAWTERVPAAFADGYVGVDEMSFADLLRLAADFAARLRYYDPSRCRDELGNPDIGNAHVGDWGDLFAGDETVTMARILATDVEAHRRVFERQLEAGPLLVRGPLRALAREIDSWLKTLSASSGSAGRALAGRIRDLIEQELAWDFDTVCGRTGIDIDGYRFDSAWTIQKRADDGEEERPERDRLRPALDAFLHAVLYLQSLAGPYLEESLRSADHDPGLGLFIAFLRLFPRAQESANTLKGRHLDFYYRQVLGEVGHAGVPDSGHLTFRAETRAGARGVLVPRGTLFSAGRDPRGQELFYASEEDLVVTDAAIRSLHTLFLESNASASPERELNFVTRAQLSGPGRPVPGEPAPGAWALFGAGDGRVERFRVDEARMGFAVASNAFLLKEGYRSVEVAISVFDALDRDERVAMLLEGLGDGRQPLDPGQRSVDGVLSQVFERFLRVAHERKRTRVMPDVSLDARRLVGGIGLTGLARVAGELAAARRQDLVHDLFLFSLLREADSETAFYDAFGRLFSRHLLTAETGPPSPLASTVGIHSSPGIRAEEILEASDLVTRLQEGGPAAAFVRGRLDDGNRRRLDRVQASVPPDPSLLDAIVIQLNGAIRNTELHLEDGFSIGVPSDVVGRLLGSDPAADDLPRRRAVVNRLLVEKAFPGVFASSWQAAILEKAAQVCSSDISLDQVRMLVVEDRHLSFFKLLRRTFSISVSTAGGWHEVDDYSMTALDPHPEERCFGLKCAFTLGPEVDPIVGCSPGVHPESAHTALPVARFLLNPHANMYAYSMFRDLEFADIDVTTRAKEIKDVLAYNNYGQLDPSKPFAPFGALPTLGSYFIFGNHEAASKPLTSLSLEVEWGDLPAGLGGFRARYEGYDTAFTNDSFRAGLSIYRDGRWIGGGEDVSPRTFPLFSTRPGGGAVDAVCKIEVDPVGSVKPLSAELTEDQFLYDVRARDGFFRIDLRSPEVAFGHKEYPAVLTRVVSANARRRRHRSVPREPYTPMINRISLDYSSRHVISPGSESEHSHPRFADGILHIHPYGLEVVHPAGKGRRSSVFPLYPHAGNLFIGLEAARLEGAITLYFHLREDSTHAISNSTPGLAWFYLSANKWEPLDPSRVLTDTTSGFLSSGIVKLDLPPGITPGNTVMPSDLRWLRLSSGGDARSFCTVYEVLPHAVRVSWQDRDNDPSHLGQRLQAGRIHQAVASIPGLDEIRQPAPTFGGRLGEDTDRLKARVSERLRHKNRAWTPWDYERLVLERFPQVAKAKCLQTMTSLDSHQPGQKISDSGIRPGHVLIVVVPRLVQQDQELSRGAMVSAVELKRIHDFLASVSSPFSEIEVRNPAYERIQVRCKVKFGGVPTGGLQINRLNQDIVRFISPWDDEDGYVARFGWRIRREDIESFVRDRDYVEYVTDFSMLRIAEEDDGDFSLGDTARVWLLDAFSLLDPSGFVQALKAASDPFTEWVKDELHQDTRLALDRFDPRDPPSGSLLTGLISDVNDLLLGAPMYDTARFSGVRLRQATVRLKDEAPSEDDLVLLNRLLLEDAMGEVISRIQPGEDEIGPMHPWSLAIPVETHYIESVDYTRSIQEEPTGIDELEIGGTFIIS